MFRRSLKIDTGTVTERLVCVALLCRRACPLFAGLTGVAGDKGTRIRYRRITSRRKAHQDKHCQAQRIHGASKREFSPPAGFAFGRGFLRTEFNTDTSSPQKSLITNQSLSIQNSLQEHLLHSYLRSSLSHTSDIQKYPGFFAFVCPQGHV